MTTTRWNRKDLLGLRELSVDEINLVLDTADAFKQVGTREIKKVPALRGRTLVNFFVEPSTRTRTSFELAAFRLSADVINISAATSSLSKGETLKDTAKILEANHVDIIVLRHSSAGAPQFLAERTRSSLTSADERANEHPTQVLLDTYTIRENKKRIEGLHVAIIGDILFSRVARSNIFALTKLGARVTLVGPSTLVPRDFEKLGVTISYDIDKVLPTADVVNLLRIQHERQRKEYFPGVGEYIRLFGLTKERAKLLKPDCLIMHPGPINRGVEIDSDEIGDLVIVDGKSADQSAIRNQKSAIEEIDATELIVAPGLIDMHVHLREPGFGHKETIASGARAAATGGFTTVVCMPNTLPVADNPSTITWIKDRARDSARVNVLPAGAISKNLEGLELAPIASIVQSGVIAITDDGKCVQNHELMRRAVEYARMVGVPVLDHCQDYNLVGHGVVNEGEWSTLLGLSGWPAAGEEAMVMRNILLAELCDHHIHCQHISAAGSIRLIREARGRGVKISG